MSKKVKAFAKINIALNVIGESNGYHILDSVVTTVNKYDLIIASKRKDNKILITFTGKYAENPIRQEETNAYKSAKLFMDTFNTKGANIEVVRNIPTGSGMGGSSADIAGVLGVLKKLYKTQGKLKPLADSLGSDSGYLLKGGYARLTSRGEVVEYLNSDLTLYFVVIYAKSGVNTKECFKKFDELGESGLISDIDSVVKGVQNGSLAKLKNNVNNALTKPAIILNKEVDDNLNYLKSLSPDYYSMTGSGSTVFSIYENYEMASWAVDTLKKKYNLDAELLINVDLKKPNIFDLLFDNLINED